MQKIVDCYRIVLTQIETKYWPLDNEIDLAKMSKNLMLSEVLNQISIRMRLHLTAK